MNLNVRVEGGSSVKYSKLRSSIALMAMLLGAGAVHAEYPLNLVKGVTETSHAAFELHTLIMWIVIAIGVVVFGAMKIKKVLQKHRGRHKSGIKFLSKSDFEPVYTGDV